jgi:Reverse transcriptase (RNA-dependent DNA polymerase)
LETILRKFNFSRQFANLILSYVTGSKFSIKLNGATRDGFITPKRGLMQGCPLSPYLFIISMEVLTRSLLAAQAQGSLSGVKLTEGAPALTHNMYVDDLVLFDQAEEGDLTTLKGIMQSFREVSRLRINNNKSVL